MPITAKVIESKIKRPTIADMIAWLGQFPPNAKLRIIDPDTGWNISIIHAFEDADGVIQLSAEYHEMNEER